MILKLRGPVVACFALLGLLKAAAAQDAANPRIALVIGETTYQDATLPTTANDAALVAQVLQAAGFDVLGARDLDEKSVRAALRVFLDKANAAGPNMQAFVYLGGRALQYEGDNFFVPVDARIARDSDAPIEAVRLTDFTHALAAAPGLARIVVVDGARANPYAAQGSPLAGGLALVDPEPGSLIAFNAAPGSVGADEKGSYGLYAKTLAGAMRQGGVGIEDVFAQTRVAVNQATAGAQIPWSASKLSAPYYVFERAADAPPPPPVVDNSRRPLKAFPADQAYSVVVQRDTLDSYQEFLADYPQSAQARRVRAILAARREALFWARSRERNDPRAYWTYLERYPKGPHAADAERRLAFLRARARPPSDFAPESYSDLPPPPEDEMIYADRPVYGFSGPNYGPPPGPAPRGFIADDDDWRDLPPPPPPTGYGVLPALAVAVPLLLGARAYHDKGRRDGAAEHGAPPPKVSTVAPPLPGGVRVQPVTAKPTPATEMGAKVPLAPATTPTPVVPGAGKPTPTPASDTGAKVRPTPSPTATTVAPTGGKPTAAPVEETGAKIRPTPTPTPTAVAPTGGKPAPTPAPTPVVPTGGKPTPALAPTEEKGAKVPPTPRRTPAAAPLEPAPSPTPQALKTSAPTIDKKPALEETRKPAMEEKKLELDRKPTPAEPIKSAPTPMMRKESAPAPIVHAAPPPAPIVHVAPPPAPAPVIHTPPPQPAPRGAAEPAK